MDRKICLITGASSGIGKAAAVQIAQKGYHVILACTQITVNCVSVTNVKVDINRFTDLSRRAQFMYSLKSKFSISTEEIAKTYTHLATTDMVDGETGKYFDEKNHNVNSSKYSCNIENINNVMDLTMKYLNSSRP